MASENVSFSKLVKQSVCAVGIFQIVSDKLYLLQEFLILKQVRQVAALGLTLDFNKHLK